MSDYDLSIGVGIPTGAPLDENGFPHLAHAVRLVLEQAHANWIAYAEGAPLPDGRRINPRTGTYARSIAVKMDGPFAGEVFTELSYARALEYGQPAWDMHKMLDGSMKVRITKEGKRYLIVPFRHGTPGTAGMRGMPESVWNAWQRGAFGASSQIVGHGWRESGTGAWSIKTKKPYLVRQRHYQWGGRVSQQQLIGMGLGEHESRRMAGMVQMQRKGAGRGGKHTQYLTFRTMSEGSPGWMNPGHPGFYVAKAVSDAIGPVAEKIFAEAAARDAEALLAR